MDIQDPGFRFAPPWASGVYHAFGVPLRSELLKLPYCRAFFYAVGVRSAGLLSSRPSRLRQGFVGQAPTSPRLRRASRDGTSSVPKRAKQKSATPLQNLATRRGFSAESKSVNRARNGGHGIQARCAARMRLLIVEALPSD